MSKLGSLNNIYTSWCFSGNKNPTSVFSLGWFDIVEIIRISNDVYDVYFMGWNKPKRPRLVMSSGWFDNIYSGNIATLEKILLSLDFKDLDPKILSEFISLVNSDDVRDIRMEVDLEKGSILFFDNTNIVSRNIGSW